MSTPKTDDLLAGRYRLRERIASGGMGEVWRASVSGPAGFEKPIAVKFLHATMEGESERVEMFLDEARLAAMLIHPNIVQTLELGEQDERYFIVMEYVDGLSVASLRHRLAKQGRRLEIGHTLHIMAGLLTALDYAHNACGLDGEPLHMVHRDVCPRNLLVARENGTVKLTDFGIARATGKVHMTGANVLMGKINRMAPEQLSHGHIDGRTDVYAAGVLFYEMLTGFQPFSHLEQQQLIDPRLREVKRWPSEMMTDLDPAIDAVVRKALEARMDDRYGSAGEMLEALAPLLRDATGMPRAVGKLVSHMMVIPTPQSSATEELSVGDLLTDRTPVTDEPILLRSPLFGRHPVVQLGEVERVVGTDLARTPGARPINVVVDPDVAAEASLAEPPAAAVTMPGRRTPRSLPAYSQSPTVAMQSGVRPRAPSHRRWVLVPLLVGAALGLVTFAVVAGGPSTPAPGAARTAPPSGDPLRSAELPAPTRVPAAAPAEAVVVVGEPPPPVRRPPPAVEKKPPMPPPVVVPVPPAASTHAYLTVTSTHTSEVVVDGKAIGKTPLLGFRLTPGRHEVRVDCLTGEARARGQTRVVDLPADAEAAIQHECVLARRAVAPP